MRVSIILSDPSRGNALRALATTRKVCGGFDPNNPAAFVGPVFENASCEFDSGFVQVRCESGDLYVYPAHSVNRVKVEQQPC